MKIIYKDQVLAEINYLGNQNNPEYKIWICTPDSKKMGRPANFIKSFATEFFPVDTTPQIIISKKPNSIWIINYHPLPHINSKDFDILYESPEYQAKKMLNYITQ